MIYDDERLDNTGFGDIRVIQKKGLGYGVDSVLLAAFAAGETGAKGLKPGAEILDLGCGSGVIGFILLHKVPACKATGIDVREGAIDRALRAADINGLEGRIGFLQSDINEYVPDRRYDAVVSNPPYFRRNAAIPNASDDKYTARHETTADIGDFIAGAAQCLKDGGDFYLVHRPDRLVDILSEMRSRGIEPRTMQLVTPKPGEAANIVLVHGVRGGGKELKMLPEIPVHNTDGTYSDIVERIYERV